MSGQISFICARQLCGRLQDLPQAQVEAAPRALLQDAVRSTGWMQDIAQFGAPPQHSKQGMYTRPIAAAACLYPTVLMEEQLGPAKHSAEAAATFLAHSLLRGPTCLQKWLWAAKPRLVRVPGSTL